MDLSKWIKETLFVSGTNRIIIKRCNEEWFKKYNHSIEWDVITSKTNYLDCHNPTFSQRLWHILNNTGLVKCHNQSCNNVPTFCGIVIGYRKFCSCKCAQTDAGVREKTIQNNKVKYGVDYVLQNPKIKLKLLDSIRKKYGVDNVSQVKEISDKKKETCLKNYGKEWFLGRQDLKKEVVKNKYGVTNIQLVKSVMDRRVKTQRENFYNVLVDTDRLKSKCIPLFSKEEYSLGGIRKSYKFKCLLCNNSFIGKMVKGKVPRCNVCYPENGTSLFEKEIYEYIKSIVNDKFEIKKNVRSILKGGRELDIYIPEKKIAIECNGLFWHGEVNGNKDKNYHLNKTIECENLGIRLFHIFEDDWKYNTVELKKKLLDSVYNLPEEIIKENTEEDRSFPIYNFSCRKRYKIEEVSPKEWFYGTKSNYKKFTYSDIQVKQIKDIDNSDEAWNTLLKNGWDRIWDCGKIKYIINE